MLHDMFEPQELAPERIRPLSRAEFEQMVELGMFRDEGLELLHGALVTMSPQGEEHILVSHWLTKRLTLKLGEPWDVFAHSPYAASDDSQPEPDVCVCAAGEPLFDRPSKAMLLIEVSNSSLSKDRHIKTVIYAEANVPEYWIVDVSGREIRIEVHTDPTPLGYRRVDILRDGDVLRPTRLPCIEIAVRDIPWRR